MQVDDLGERERALMEMVAEIERGTSALSPPRQDAVRWALGAIDGCRAIIKALQEDLRAAEGRGVEGVHPPELERELLFALTLMYPGGELYPLLAKDSGQSIIRTLSALLAMKAKGIVEDAGHGKWRATAPKGTG